MFLLAVIHGAKSANADFIEYVETSNGSSVFWNQLTLGATFTALLSQTYSGPFDDPYSAAFIFENSPISGSTFSLFPSWIEHFTGASVHNSVTGQGTITHLLGNFPPSVADVSTYSASGVISKPGGGVIQGTVGVPVPIVMQFTMGAFFENMLLFDTPTNVQLTLDSLNQIELQGTLIVTPSTISYSFPQQSFELDVLTTVTIGASGSYVTIVPEPSSWLLGGGAFLTAVLAVWCRRLLQFRCRQD
ncbi:MAG: hypothetical protein AB7U73_21690 [Pirellulales bacterium]